MNFLFLGVYQMSRFDCIITCTIQSAHEVILAINIKYISEEGERRGRGGGEEGERRGRGGGEEGERRGRGGGEEGERGRGGRGYTGLRCDSSLRFDWT